jgi:hypothetical protein
VTFGKTLVLCGREGVTQGKIVIKNRQTCINRQAVPQGKKERITVEHNYNVAIGSRIE